MDRLESLDTTTVAQLITMLNTMPQDAVIIVGASGSFSWPSDGVSVDYIKERNEVTVECDF
jgi:hypothetical protein